MQQFINDNSGKIDLATMFYTLQMIIQIKLSCNHDLHFINDKSGIFDLATMIYTLLMITQVKLIWQP